MWCCCFSRSDSQHSETTLDFRLVSARKVALLFANVKAHREIVLQHHLKSHSFRGGMQNDSIWQLGDGQGLGHFVNWAWWKYHRYRNDSLGEPRFCCNYFLNCEHVQYNYIDTPCILQNKIRWGNFFNVVFLFIWCECVSSFVHTICLMYTWFVWW